METTETTGLHAALAVVRRRRWLTLGVLATALTITAAVAFGLPSLYRASAAVLVDRQHVPDTFVRPAIAGEVETRLQWINQQILTRARLEELVARFDLYPELRRRAPVEAVVDQMRRDTQFEVRAVEQPGRGAAAIAFTLSYRGRDPETVAEVANALAFSYVEQNSTARTRQATETAEFLKARLAEMKQKLEAQERRMGQMPPRVEADIATLEALNTRLRMNSDRQLRALDRRERLVRDPGAPDLAGPAPDPTAVRLATLKRELAELRTRFTDKYPDVIRVKADIEALERTLAESGRGRPASTPARPARDPLADLDAQIKVLMDEERSLRQAIASVERRVETAPQREQEYQQRARDHAATKELYESLLKRYEDAQIAESLEQGRKGEQYRLLDPAVPPRLPVGPDRGRLFLVGLALSLGATLGAVILAERLDTSFHSVDELRRFTRVPVLAGIPPLATAGDAAEARRRRGLAGASAVAGLALVGGLVYWLAQRQDMLARALAQ